MSAETTYKETTRRTNYISDQQQIKTRPKLELASTTSHSGNVLK